MEPVPHLAKLVAVVYSAMDVRFKDKSQVEINQSAIVTKGCKVRLAYLRLLFAEHRKQLIHKPEQKTPSVW